MLVTINNLNRCNKKGLPASANTVLWCLGQLRSASVLGLAQRPSCFCILFLWQRVKRNLSHTYMWLQKEEIVSHQRTVVWARRGEQRCPTLSCCQTEKLLKAGKAETSPHEFEFRSWSICSAVVLTKTATSVVSSNLNGVIIPTLNVFNVICCSSCSLW